MDEEGGGAAELALEPFRAEAGELPAGRELRTRDRLGDVRLLASDDLGAVEGDVVVAAQDDGLVPADQSREAGGRPFRAATRR
jgi:hypothetical protein